MLQILNIDQYYISLSTSYTGGQGRPLYVKLKFGEHTMLGQNALKRWPTGAKQNLASYVQKAQLRVNEVACVHTTIDKGHKLPPFWAVDLTAAIAAVLAWKDVYNTHLLSNSIHTAQDVANLIVAVDPVDLATLTTYIVTCQGSYNAHRLAAVHPNADTLNVVAAPTGTLTQNIGAIQELYGRFTCHKRQCLAAGAVLTPPAVITY